MRRRIDGWVLTLALVLLEAAGLWVAWQLVLQPYNGAGFGSVERYYMTYEYADGRVYNDVIDSTTGTLISRALLRPASWQRQVEVWWPVMAASCLTLAALSFSARRNRRSLLDVLRRTRWTIGRFMIAVAVFAVECGVFLAWMRAVRLDPAKADWPLIALGAFGWNALLLVPVGIVLIHRRGNRPESSPSSEVQDGPDGRPVLARRP